MRKVVMIVTLGLVAPSLAAQNGYSFLDANTSPVDYTATVTEARAACADLFSVTTYDYSVVSAGAVSADESGEDAVGVCRVSGVIPPEIRFEVSLPLHWNGRLYMHGNGGFAGTPPESPNRQRLRDRALAHGFATAYTDTGHDSRVHPLGTFAHDDLQKLVDYSFRAVHLTVVTAKDLSDRFYGQRPAFSYWDGCSTGGRQGLMSAQRFPEDFDGIIAGAPVLDFTGTMGWYVWNGRALDGVTLDRGHLAAVTAAVNDRCDTLDGVRDGLLEDPRRCDFRPDRDLVHCTDTKMPRSSCFTNAQIEALTKIYDGPVVDGTRLYPGQPIGAELRARGDEGPSGWDNWLVREGRPTIQRLFAETFLRYLAFPDDDPEMDWSSVDLGKDLARMQPLSEMLDATHPDLTRFRDRGGKILSYFGWADTALNPLAEIEYLERVAEVTGSPDSFFRLFMVPGMFHCRGGAGVDRLDALTPLIAWVENGLAPDRLVASRAEGDDTTLTRPLCPYPQVAHYGGGDPDVAASFECKSPDSAGTSSGGPGAPER